MEDQPDIYCPRCEYRPRLEDRWDCMPSCATRWHTFWTAGVCPGCGHAWEKTQCPACAKLSPHRAWYHVRAAAPGEHAQADLAPASA
jgi:hypothetical protein